MAGFCREHGASLNEKGVCPVCRPTSDRGKEKPEEPPSDTGTGGKEDIGPLPPAHRFRRLLGSGIEFSVYIVALPLISAIPGPGYLIWLAVVSLILLRDFNAGAFNIAKRVSRMKVVHWRRGQPASNAQSFMRNVNYIGLLAIAALPGIGGCVACVLLLLFAITDIMFIVANPQGRRLGDFLAGTQVVEQGG